MLVRASPFLGDDPVATGGASNAISKPNRKNSQAGTRPKKKIEMDK